MTPLPSDASFHVPGSFAGGSPRVRLSGFRQRAARSIPVMLGWLAVAILPLPTIGKEVPGLSPSSNRSAGSDLSATEFARVHVERLLLGHIDELKHTYAPEITLLPGHEFLNPRHGLTDAPTGGHAIAVKRETLLQAMASLSKRRKTAPPEKLKALLQGLRFEVLAAPAGDYATAPADPVPTPDRMLHFLVEKEDRIIKISPPKGDFLLLQLRRIDSSWKVVAEYVD